ncbi:MAG: ankyrin repeat domain-containing protein [Alphaproteobacteria bacterium]
MPRRTAPSVAAHQNLAVQIEDGMTLQALYAALKAGADPNMPDDAGMTPMQAAIERDWWKGADMLLAYGAAPPAYKGDPNGRPLLSVQTDRSERETALTYMLKYATWFRPVYEIIANNADLNLKNKNDETPLAAVVKRGWPHAAVELALRGAWIDPENPDHDEVLDRKTGAPRLLCAVLQGADPAGIETMLKNGADPNKPDDYGLYPLAAAKALNWKYMADRLRAHGAREETAALPDPNQTLKDGQPLLVYAINYQNCHENYIHALIKHGADPNAPDKEGRTAMHWAAIMGKDNVFDALRQAGGDILRETAPDNGLRPLHYACMNGRLYIAESILEDCPPAHINAPCKKNGETPLHFAAARRNNAALVKMLLEYGANINLRNADGLTPVMHAVDTRDPELLRTFLRGGADITKPDTQARLNPPLFQLVNSPSSDNAAVAEQLLDHGADPNDKAHTNLNGPNIGESLIHFSIRYRANDLAQLLLKNGADPHGTDEAGESAAHYCLHLREKEGLKILLENGFDPLRVFTYNKKWHRSDGDVREEKHKGSALDCARELTEKFGTGTEYSDMLEMIEKHIAASTPQAPRKTALRTLKR